MSATPQDTPVAPIAAAVLIPIVSRGGAEQILLLRRPERSGDPYSGQVCLPGGRLEPVDGDSLRSCALRETHEETGIPPDAIDVFLELDWHETAVGHRVKPFAGRVRGAPELRPNRAEVDRLLWLPLADLRPELFRNREGARDTNRFELDGCEVWGLTARVLAAFEAHRAAR